MSRENVEIIRRGWEYFLATGEQPLEIIAPDFTWDMSRFRGWPEQQSYEGVEGMDTFIRDWTQPFDEWEMEVDSFHDAGEQVVSLCRQRARSKTTGVPVDMSFAMVWTLRDGLEVRMEMYADWAEALEAVGLEK
jgi:ketosteroid isomerase-like protein